MGRLLVSGARSLGSTDIFFVICTCAFRCVYLLSVEIKKEEEEEEEEEGEEEEWKVDQRILIKDLTR